jgi:putative DNA primase/helicase
MKIDFEALAREHQISAVVGRRVRLEKAGKGEFKGLCPFHNEKSPSFTVSDAKEFYHCYGCGEHGDVVDFIARIDGVSIGQAARTLTGADEWKPTRRDPERAAVEQFDPYAGIEVAEIGDSHEMFQPGAEIEVWNPRKERIWRMRPSMVFPYRDIDGELLGYVMRVEFDDGKKVTPTVRYVRLADGSEAWATVPFPTPRPLYWPRAPIATGQIIIVEGEKAADAAARLLPPLSVCTWPGGTQGVKHACWDILAGRSVVIWPDADEPGMNAARDIAARLAALGCVIKIAEPEETRAKGWDAADAEAEGWGVSDAVAWLRANALPYQPDAPPPPEPPPPEPPEPEQPEPEDDAPPPPPPIEGEPTKPRDLDAYYQVLGFDGGYYYYMPRGTRQLVALSASSHTWKNLIQLAPLDYWEREFGSGRNGELAAANALMNSAHRAGTYHPDRLRGRGAWTDGSEPVFHLGQFALSRQRRIDLYEASQTYIYPATRPMRNVNLDVEPAGATEAKRVADLCARLNWENPLSAVALAGWIAIAPVCGALHWRPHIWISGGAGSGKTTVLLDVVWRLIGVFAQRFEGSTTEAGIRQTLGADAMPIVLDEAEAESERAQMRITGILDLARLASSGSTVSKGTASGEAMSFTVRSAFCFSSIEHSIKQHADETRITKLVLRKRVDEKAEEAFKALMADIRAWFTPTFASALFLRTWANIDALLANVATCVDAAAQELKDRRAADQIGTLIAGYVSLHTTRKITFDEAVGFVRRYDWHDHTAIAARPDRERLLERILTSRLMVTSGGANKQATVAELIQSARGMQDTHVIEPSDAKRQLAPLGIKVTPEGVAIAATGARFGREILRGTQWEADWSRPLRELDGAQRLNVTHFAPGLKARGTLLPWRHFEAPSEVPGQMEMDAI